MRNVKMLLSSFFTAESINIKMETITDMTHKLFKKTLLGSFRKKKSDE